MEQYSVYKLSRMKKEELLRLAADYGCQISPDAKRTEVLDAVKSKIQSGSQPAAAPSKQPGNAALFDELTQPGEDAAEEQQGDHGGPRAGAGRIPGKSNLQCRIDNLPTEPNRSIVYIIKYFFKLWSAATDCKEIALDDDELKEFAVDTTQFLEYHGIRIPEGVAVDGKFILGGLELVGGRVMILKAHKARLKRQAEKEQQNPGGQA